MKSLYSFIFRVESASNVKLSESLATNSTENLLKKFILRTAGVVALFLFLGGSVWGQSTANYSFSTNTTGSLALLSDGTTAVDMSVGTTQLVGPGLDATSSALNSIGFNFIFMGNLFTQFSVNEDGLLQLGGTAVSTNLYTISGGTSSLPALSAFNADLRTGSSTGKIHFKLIGTAPNRCLVVEFTNMYLFYTSSGGTGAASWQMRLYETTGVVEYVYGGFSVSSITSTNRSPSIGFYQGSAAGSFVSVTYSSNTATTTGTYTANSALASTGNIASLNSASNGSRRVYRFTPPVPAAPTAMTFNSVGLTAMTLNWTDNATNEIGYVIQRSTDNTNFTQVGTTAANTTSYMATGLSANTTYYWRVYAISEGAVSSNLTGSQSTSVCPTYSGTMSVGPSSATFPNLTTAISNLTTCGYTGNIILELQSGYVSTGETFPLTFGTALGSNTNKRITIRPASGSTNLSITSANTTATIDLNGASFITFDGRAGGSGTARNLSIGNTGGTAVPAIRFINDANNNTVQYCTVTSSVTSTTSGLIVFSSTTGTNGNDNNTIDNCDLNGGGTAANIIYANGTGNGAAATANNNVTISNNLIRDQFVAASATNGILVANGNGNWTISGNSFYQTNTRTYSAGSTHTAININHNTHNGVVITNNIIGGSNSTGGGTAWTVAGAFANRFIGINLTVGTTTAASVQGNTISNFAWSSTSGATTLPGVWCGIYSSTGSLNIGTVSANTIGATSATGSVTSTISTTGGISIGIGVEGAGTVNISNNNIGSITAAGSTTSIGHSFTAISSTVTGTITISANNIGSATIANSINSSSTNSSATGQSVVGISVSGAATTSTTISNNIIANLNNASTGNGSTTFNTQIRGIVVGGTPVTVSVTGNTVRNLSSACTNVGTGASASVIGMTFSGSTSNTTVSQNTLYALSNISATANATGVIGINYSGPTTGTNVVARNFIYGLSSSGTAATGFNYGVNVSGGTANFQNNMIVVGQGNNNGIDVRGINDLVGTNNYYHNTVYVGGAPTSNAANTYAFNSAVTVNTRAFQNNIFFNGRSNSGSTGKHYAITVAGTAANPTGLTSNRNIIFANGSGGVLGLFNNTDQASLSAWQTVTGQDANSFNSNPQLVNPTGATPDLHINTANVSVAESGGVLIAAVTDDYDGQTRSGLTPIDIGADAFVISINCATSPLPSNGSIDAVLSPTLSWTASNATGYDVYLGTTSGLLTLVASNQAGLSYTPSSALLPSTIYYWSIVPRIGNNLAAGCSEWSFTTQAATPTLSATSLTSFANQCVNTTSSANSFNLSGVYLTTADITVGPLSGFAFSSTSNGTYTSTLTISQSGGTLASTPVYVQFTPTSPASFNGNIPVSGGGVSTAISVSVVGLGIDTPATANTGSSSAVTTTSATAAGSFVANCQTISAYGIEYSTTSGFSGGTGTQVISTNQASGSYTSNLTSLSPATTYFFRAYVTYGSTTVYGTTVGTFSTPALEYTSAATGNWNSTTTWVGGVVPVCGSNVTIASGHNVTVNSSSNVSRNLTINSGGTLTVASGDLTVGCSLNNTPLTNNGTLTVSGGTLNVNGNLSCGSSSVFNQSGGNINIDGNNGGSTTGSVASGTPIVSLSQPNTGINLTGGILTIVDPHTASLNTSAYAFYYSYGTAGTQTSTSNHLTRFGNGISTDAGGNASGFYVNQWASTAMVAFGSLEINGPSGNNRSFSLGYTTVIRGDLTINSNARLDVTSNIRLQGNLVVNSGGVFASTALLSLQEVIANTSTTSTAAPVTVAQSISGSGTFQNATTGSTANLASLTINNTSAGGVTIATPLSISGTLTMTAGKINTTATNLLTLGTSTAAGTLAYTAGQISGPFARTFAASRTAAGTYDVSTLFPVGDGTTYLPVHIDPTTTAGGSVVMRGQAFNSNSGTGGPGVATALSTNRWEAIATTGSSYLSNCFVGLNDATIASGRIIAQSTSASGTYNTITPTSTFVSAVSPLPNGLRTATAITSSNYSGYFTHALPGPAITSFTPTNACPNAATTITITGTNLGSATSVTLNGETCTIVSNTATQIVVTTDATPQAGNIVVTTAANSATSATTLSLFTLPTVTASSNASNNTVCSGTSVTLNGGGATSYAWNNSVLNNVAFTPTATTTYTVTGTDGNGCTNTASVAITVNNAVVISSQPSNQIVLPNDIATFSVSVTGTGLTYQWEENTGSTWTAISNGGIYSGATTNTLTLTGVSTQTGYQYRCIVAGTAPCGSVTSSAATLTISSTAITAQPASATICSNGSNTFSISTSGSTPTYQWQVSADAGLSYTDISGATTSSLTISGLTSANSGNRYRCVLSGSINSDAAVITVYDAVVIGTQPTSLIVCSNAASASFSVSATGSNLTYQWQVSTNGGSSWSNASGTSTNSTYTVSTLSNALNLNQYRVIVSGSSPCASVTSNAATLNVTGVTLAASSASICMNGSVTLTATPTSGSPTLSYSWICATAGSGATTANTSNPATITPTAVGSYTYTLTTTGGGCTLTSTASVTVNANPSITSATASPSSICAGSNVSLSATGQGSGPTTMASYTSPPAVTYPTSDEDVSGIVITQGFNTILSNSSANNSLVGTIGTASGTAGSYSDFTGFGPFTLTGGNSYNFTVSSSTSGSAYSNALAIYIDYNRDGDFVDAGEQVYTSAATTSGAHSESGSFTVPISASAGYTRMRVISNEGLISSPTATVSYGEFEEYKINLIGDVSSNFNWSWNTTPALLAATGTTAAANNSSLPISQTYSVTATNPTTGCTSTATTSAITINPVPAAPTATNSSQCGQGIPTGTIASNSGLGSPNLSWYTAASNGSLVLSSYTGALTDYYSNDFASGSGTGVVSGNASVTGGVMQLTPNSGNQLGALTIPASGISADKYKVSFNIITSAAAQTGADGLSYSFGDDVSGTSTTVNAETGSGSKLKVSFDAYGTSGNGISGIRVLYGATISDPGTTVGTNGVLAYNSSTAWTNGNIPVIIEINALGQLTLTVNGTAIFTNLALPAAYLTSDKSTWLHGFKARTGGVSMAQSVDNVTIQQSAYSAATSYPSSISSTTTYYVIESNGGCSSAAAPITFTVNTPPSISASASSSTICAGQSTTLSASSSNSGYSYTWSNGTGSGASVSVSPTTTTTYTVTGTDNSGGVNNGCSSTANVSVTVNPVPTSVTASSNSATVCNGTSVNLSSGSTSNSLALTLASENFDSGLPSGWAVIQNGTGNLWAQTTSTTYGTPYAGAGMLQYVYNSTYAANTYAISSGYSLIAGVTYTINFYELTSNLDEKLKLTVGTAQTAAAQSTVIMDYGVHQLATWTLRTNTFTPTTSGVYYFGLHAYSAKNKWYIDIDNFTITYSPPSSYSWASSPIGFNSSSQNPAGVSPTQTTTYTVTATNSYNCSSTANTTVTVNQPSVAPTGISGTTSICIAQSTTLTATGGTLGTGANYEWGTGSTIGSNAIVGETSASITVTPSNNTTYWVRITNGTAPCTVTTSGVSTLVTVTNPATPVVTAIDNCDGTSTLSTTATGTLAWSNGASTTPVIVSTAGTYTVTQTANGCTSAAGSGVAAPKSTPATPVVSVTNDCGLSTLSFTPASNATILWSNSATTSSTTTTSSETITVVQTVNGCPSAAGSGSAVPLVIPSAPTATASQNFCVTDNATVGSLAYTSVAGNTYTWYDAATAGNTVATSTQLPTATTTYYLSTTGSNGCTSLTRTAVTATEAAQALASVSITGGTSCEGTAVTFYATPTNGGNSPTYQWYNGGVPISGETGNTYIATGLAEGAVITVKMIPSGSCVTVCP